VLEAGEVVTDQVEVNLLGLLGLEVRDRGAVRVITNRTGIAIPGVGLDVSLSVSVESLRPSPWAMGMPLIESEPHIVSPVSVPSCRARMAADSLGGPTA
jgi:hypothetical protein